MTPATSAPSRCENCPVPPGIPCPAVDGTYRAPHERYCQLVAERPDPWAAKVLERALSDMGASPFRRDPARLNVGFVGSGYWPQGGTERWHQTLLPRLAAMPDLSIVGYAVTWESSGPPIGDIPIGQGQAAARAVMALSDVVVCWGITDLAPLVPAARRPKIIGVSHGSPGSAWNVECVEGMARVADVRAAVSLHAARAWPGGADGVAVIPNAVDPAAMVPGRPREAIRRELGILPGEVACLAVGWVSEGKRVHLAAAGVARLGAPFRLFVAGDGPKQDEVRAAGGDRVTILGRREDVADLMAAADLLVHPSASEGMALVHVEAMMAGLPVISTPVGHLADEPELARIVPLDAGPTGWAAAIAADWRDGTARRQRVVLARAAAEADCTVDRHAAAWAGLIRAQVPETTMGPAPLREPAPPPTGLRVQGKHTPPTRGRQAVERRDMARACDYRLPLDPQDAAGCGCSGKVTAICLAGKSRREDQRVSLGECVACSSGQ